MCNGRTLRLSWLKIKSNKARPNKFVIRSDLILTMSSISIKVEFGGGLELLFANQKTYGLSIPSRVPKDNSAKEPEVPIDESSSKPADVEFLIHYLRDVLLKERPELFMEGSTV